MDKRIWLTICVICCASGSSVAGEEWFSEESAARGLRFLHFNGATGEYYLPESLGSGAALIDYDGDGDLDVYLLQGAALDPRKAGWRPPGAAVSNRLFRNWMAEEGKLRFTDVTAAAGVGVSGYSLGAAVGDYDGDGHDDLFVTGVGRTVLFRNTGRGAFTDVTAQAGVTDARVSTGAAFFDYDRDDDLDLIVLSYVDFAARTNKRCPGAGNRLDYCQPAVYHPLPARLFRNEGGGRFSDRSEASGIGSAAGAGLGVAVADFNADGWLDLYVANDGTPNHLWMNQRDGAFEEAALPAGAAFDDQGRAQAGMGVAAADYDGDGDEDVIVANLMGESLALYENDGEANFRYATAARKLTLPSLPFTGFGTAWADFDGDGWLDLFVANGSVKVLEGGGYGQRNQLFRGGKSGAFSEMRSPLLDSAVLASRGVALGDLNADGALDLVVMNGSAPAHLLLNRHADERLLTIHLERHRKGLPVEGTRVGLFRRGLAPQWRRSSRTGSYLSSNDPDVHFGLGRNAAPIERIEIEWPDGARESVAPVAAQERRMVIRQQPKTGA